jgi:hypothetical protein
MASASASASVVGAASPSLAVRPAGSGPPSVADWLPDVARPHVASFNYMLEQGLAQAVRLMEPVIIEATEDKPRVKRTREAVCVYVLPAPSSSYPPSIPLYAGLLISHRLPVSCLLHTVWIEQADIGFPARTGGAYREARIFPNEVHHASRVACVSICVGLSVQRLHPRLAVTHRVRGSLCVWHHVFHAVSRRWRFLLWSA